MNAQGLSKAALRKRVSRIEKKMEAGGNPTQAELMLVREYRRTHKKYNTGTTGTKAALQSVTRDLDDADADAIREQMAIEGITEEGAPTGQTDTETPAEETVTVGDDGEVTTVITDDVTTLAGEVMENVTSQTGVCPVATCRTPLVDGQLRCGKCGAWARPDLCPKCRTPFGEGEQFCRRDATPRPTATAVTVKPGTAAPVAVEPIRMWDARNTRWLMDVVDLGLDKGGMDKLDEDERKQLVAALVPVLNKQLPASGRWAEEIRLGVVAAGVFFPRFYIRYVIVPERQARERRKEELHRAEVARIEAETERARNNEPVTVDVKAK